MDTPLHLPYLKGTGLNGSPLLRLLLWVGSRTWCRAVPANALPTLKRTGERPTYVATATCQKPVGWLMSLGPIRRTRRTP